jgi:hypothetical protein
MTAHFAANSPDAPRDIILAIAELLRAVAGLM